MPMVSWAEFAAEAPELASLGEARVDATGLCADRVRG
jgi:hypothetical protein